MHFLLVVFLNSIQYPVQHQLASQLVEAFKQHEEAQLGQAPWFVWGVPFLLTASLIKSINVGQGRS